MTKIHFLMLTFLDSVNIWLLCTFIEIAKNYKENIHAETLITFAICSISSFFVIIKLEYVKGHTYFFENIFWDWATFYVVQISETLLLRLFKYLPYYLKVSQFQKQIVKPWILPNNKQMNTFLLICFLEEIQGTKKTFQNHLTFKPFSYVHAALFCR